jgi:hypothetical protein
LRKSRARLSTTIAVVALLAGSTLPAQAAPAAGASTVVWESAGPHMSLASLAKGTISLLQMDPTALRYRFLPGYKWPEKSPRTKADHDPTTWVPGMVAAFNGGFKLSDGVGGYYYQGRMVAPLRDGLASMVFTKDGSLRVVAWTGGATVTPDVLAVRQNLKPLVLNGRIQTRASDGLKTWGVNIRKGTIIANRSALGMRADGTLVFGFAYASTPETLAKAMVAGGVQTAIALDMNGLWPTGYLYRHTATGVVGRKINTHIVRSPKLYLDTTNKDFVVVLSPELLAAAAAGTTAAG